MVSRIEVTTEDLDRAAASVGSVAHRVRELGQRLSGATLLQAGFETPVALRQLAEAWRDGMQTAGERITGTADRLHQAGALYDHGEGSVGSTLTSSQDLARP